MSSVGDVRVQFLGTGSPLANAGRLQTCVLVEYGNQRTLVDCGMTALVSLARWGIDPGTIDTILLTHLHGDHFGGLAPLLLEARAPAALRGPSPARTQPLCIAGPAGTEERVQQLLAALGWPGPVATLKDADLLEFVTLEPRRELVLGALTVTAYPVVHSEEATALRVTCGGKTIAYSGDTGWTEVLREVAADADLFICMAYTFEGQRPLVLSYRTLLEHRKELTCQRLVLTHIGPQLDNRRAEVTETVAEDGMTIVL